MRRVGTRSGLPYGACSSETSNSSSKARVPNLAQSQTSSSSIPAPPPAPLYSPRWRWSPAGAKQCSMRGLGPRRPTASQAHGYQSICRVEQYCSLIHT